MKKIVGERLYLKEIDHSEIDDRVLSWFDDEELMKYYSNSKNKITKEGLLLSINEGKKTGFNITYGIYDISNDLIIGTIKLGPIMKAHRISDLVALIGDRDYLGKGLSVEAISLGNKLAFEVYDLRKLYGGMYVSNIPSIKAYTRAGWIVEGRLKGFYEVDGKNEDRLLVGCFNPNYFSDDELNELNSNQSRYYE